MLFPLYSSLQRFWLKFQAWCIRLKSPNDPAELASEHTLCPQCQHSVNSSITLHSEQRSKGSEPFRQYPDIRDLEDSASPLAAGCHLCSLVLGRLRENAEQQTSAPITSIDVSIRTSRSGGVTFLIESGTDTRNRWRGELVLVPQDDWEEFVTLSRQTDTRPGFVFPPATQHIYQNAQIAKSLASNASFSLAREWLQKCLGQHHSCSEASQMSNCRPSRLIHVGDDNGTDPRLVHTNELPSSQRLEFLTLSHCWGGAAILRLLSDNVARLSTGIPMPDLPKTFQDAVIITRRLGYRYLWIDSLCIIQDSVSDWRTCSAVMGEIYATSVCTIAALTARNAYDGCFFENARNPLFFRHCRILPGWWVESNKAVDPSLRSALTHSVMPLHTRGWVVQERILGPRTLYYGSNGLAWECVECSATEMVAVGEVKEFSPKASFFALNTHRDDPQRCHEYWLQLQSLYTSCLLTQFSDRLVAISGVIKRLEMFTGWSNHWGLWKETFLMDLLWFVDDSTRTRPQTKEYLAPTWSWAGVEGRVFLALKHGVEPGSWRWKAEVMHVGYAGENEQRGCARLLAMIKRVRCIDGSRLNPGIETLAPSFEEVGWEPDVWPTPTQTPSEVYCILIARVIGDVEQREPDSEIGLVVQETAGGLERLGLWRQRLDEREGLFPKVTTGAVEVVLV